MSETNRKTQQPVISREFAAKLNRLSAKQKVRAIILLQAAANGTALTQRPSRQERKDAIEEVREVSRSFLPEIDQILARYDGKRLSEDVDALGSITVESTAEGIKALADSDHVKAILEDQSIFQFSSPKN